MPTQKMRGDYYSHNFLSPRDPGHWKEEEDIAISAALQCQWGGKGGWVGYVGQ